MSRIKISDLKVLDGKNCFTDLSKQELNIFGGDSGRGRVARGKGIVVDIIDGV